MERHFNVSGNERKSLVMKAAELTGERPVYLGMPTAAFKVGSFQIGKNGELSWNEEDSEAAEQLLEGLREAGYTAQEDGTAENTPEEPVSSEEENRLSISVSDDLTDEQYGLLKKLVRGKATLLKHAFQTETLEIEREDGKLTFPWFTASDGGHTQAYILFLTKLIEMVKKAKRVSVHDGDVENERYAMRCFCLRLGFIGTEYKGARRILLENLTGSTAWKSGRPEEQTHGTAENTAETTEKIKDTVSGESGENTNTEEVPA